MENKNFTYSFTSSKSPEEVFRLLLDVRKWWSGFFGETISGKSNKVNDEFVFDAGAGMHHTEQKLVELVPDKKVVWLVTGSNLSFLSDPAEWTNTKLGFDISPTGNKTKVTFTHDGLVPAVECYDQCSAGWTKYLDQLKDNLQ